MAQDTIRHISGLFDEPAWLRALRLRAWKASRKMPVPELTYGIGISTDLSRLDPGSLDMLKTAELHAEGRTSMQSDGCPGKKGIIITDLHTAAKQHPGIVRKHLFSLNRPDDRFAALHAALWTRGLFVRVPQGVECKRHLQFRFGADAPALADHVLVVAEPASRMTIVEATGPGRETLFRSHGVEIAAAENSQVNYANVQTLSNKTVLISNRRAVAGAGSRVDWTDCSFGSRLTISRTMNDLAGQGSQATVHGLFYASGTQHFDLHASTSHNAPETVSEMRTRGVLSCMSRAICHGRVSISEDAPRSDGYQKEDALMLSPNAHADALPQLEIRNNDVRCTHGATIGQVDSEKLFYLMSRGLSREQALRTIVRGFFEPLLLKIGIKGVQDRLRALINEKMMEGS